jgi:hypothetical protein
MSQFSRSSSAISIGVTGNTVDVGLSTFATIQRRGVGIRQTGHFQNYYKYLKNINMAAIVTDQFRILNASNFIDSVTNWR